MIRRWVHGRLMRRYEPYTMLSIVASASWLQKREGSWLTRYTNWHVAKWGEKRGASPRWLRPFDRFHSWLCDWEGTLALWFGRNVRFTREVSS